MTLSFFAEVFQNFINNLGGTITAILMLLPSSPFTWDISTINNGAFKIFMWLVPVADFLVIMEAYTTAVALYYAIRVALRWIKIVGS